MGHTEWRRDNIFVLSGLGDISSTARTKAIANQIVHDHNVLPKLVEALEAANEFFKANDDLKDYDGDSIPDFVFNVRVAIDLAKSRPVGTKEK